MTGWKGAFQKGVTSFRSELYEDAITQFTEALALGGDASMICDSRAAVYQKLGKLKEALRDSKTVIDSQPSRWQGYARSARLFLQVRKFDAAARMVDLALQRLPSEQAARRDEILALQADISSTHGEAVQIAARLKSERTYHFGKLPVEIATLIFSLLLAEDHACVVILAQVCQHWRAAILSAPAFWGTLVLTHKNPVRKLKLWKERSGNRIRDIAIIHDLSTLPAVLDDLTTLSTNSLDTLRLEQNFISFLCVYLPSIGRPVQESLRGLDLAKPNFLRGQFRRHQNTLTFHCQTLHIFDPYSLHWPEISDNLVDLESLSLSNCLGSDDRPYVLWLLYKNPNLTQLTLGHLRISRLVAVLDRKIPSTILLRNLVELTLFADMPDRLLPLLSLPSLKFLQFESCRMPLTISLQCLASGAASTLTSLSIKSAAFDLQMLLNMLATADALESLQLVSVGNNNAKPVLEALANPIAVPAAAAGASQNTRLYCSALRHLDCSRNADVTGGPLIRLIKSRLPTAPDGEFDAAAVEAAPAHRLQSLTIDDCPAVDPEILPWIREKVAVVSCVYMSKKKAAWKR